MRAKPKQRNYKEFTYYYYYYHTTEFIQKLGNFVNYYLHARMLGITQLGLTERMRARKMFQSKF